ncbi:MAG: two-component regulator propeller domain-containing protein [Akkermansia sp.]
MLILFFKLQLRLILILCGLLPLLPCSLSAEDKQNTRKISIPQSFPECPVLFIRDAIVAKNGTLWVAGENSGIYRLNVGSTYDQSWFNMNYYDGLPATNHFTCLAEDKEGRIWAGSDRMGVAVFNGQEWKVYDRENALCGEHVYDIAVSLTTGEVAVATSGGISLYDSIHKKWTDLTRADGLVEDQVESLTFDKDGNLWLAYACGGVSKRNKTQKKIIWQTTQTKWFWDNQQRMRQPANATGVGLPSNLCNTILSDQDGSIFVGTCSGLSMKKQNASWIYKRGQDYDDKNENIYGAKKKRSKTRSINLLPEDYITCLAETTNNILVGTRSNGAAKLSKKSLHVLKYYEDSTKNPMPCKWITSILPLPDGTILAATYGKGLTLLERGSGSWSSTEQSDISVSSFPVVPPVLSPQQIRKTASLLLATSPGAGSINKKPVFWREDWETRGDWCLRYGRSHTLLCANNAPFCDISLSDPSSIPVSVFLSKEESDKSPVREMPYDTSGFMGPNRQKNDCLRSWVHWVNKPENRNVLYSPVYAVRTESEWDDHGEEYARYVDGPDIYLVIIMPKGAHTFSLYFYNPNPWEGAPGLRDYVIEIKPFDHDLNIFDLTGEFRPKTIQKIENKMKSIIESPVLARARVRNFGTGGVYKSFLINQEGYYCVKICRNNSFNTILNGVFFDCNRPITNRQWGLGKVFEPMYCPTESRLDINYAGIAPAPEPLDHQKLSADQNLVISTWNKILDFNGINEKLIAASQNYFLHSYRSFAKENVQKNKDWIQNMRWELKLWNEQEHLSFDETMKRSWNQKQELMYTFRSKAFTPNSPGVVPFTIKELEIMDKNNIDWKQYRGNATPSVGMEELKKLFNNKQKNEKKS